jgi:hypothetical protein
MRLPACLCSSGVGIATVASYRDEIACLLAYAAVLVLPQKMLFFLLG